MKFDIFIKGKLVDLEIFKKNILLKTNFYTWLNDQKITKFIANAGYFPITRKEEIEYYEQNIKSKKRIQLGIVLKKYKKLIGVLSLYNINHIDGTCNISVLLNQNEKKINSLHFFSEAQSLLIDHAFKKLNLRRIEAAAASKQMLELNKKLFGFKCEGVMKEQKYVDGKYIDIYMLALLKKNWK